MIRLRDNTSYSIASDEVECYLPLMAIANRSFKDLIKEYGANVLTYPHSFGANENKNGEDAVLSIQQHLAGNLCKELKIKTGNVAGFIGVGDQLVSIGSRFAEEIEDDHFLHYMLEHTANLQLVYMPHGATDESVFDFLLFLFPNMLENALNQGIYRTYQHNEYNDANLRGRIDVDCHLRQNTPFCGRVAYRTREFSQDNPTTQLVRHTIEYILSRKIGKELLGSRSDIQENVRSVVLLTPSYNRADREKVIKANMRSRIHPYYTAWSPLRELCLRILRHDKLKYGDTACKIYGILFDVAYLWEEYLATLLIKQGFQHPDNRKGKGAMYLAENRKWPRYPDFYHVSRSIIADAKYKREIERNDIHQMITYMYRLKGKHGVFIQPTTEDSIEEVYKLLDQGGDNNAQIRMYPFLIPQKAESYKAFKDQIRVSETRFLDALFDISCQP